MIFFVPVLFSDLKELSALFLQVYLRESFVLVFRVHFSREHLHLLPLPGTTNPSTL